MSDWTARPLSQRQMHYAALDAFVLPQLFDTLCLQLGEQRSQQLLKQHTTCVRRVSAASEAQQQQQQARHTRQASESAEQQQQGNPHKRHAEAVITDAVQPITAMAGADAAAVAAAAVVEACKSSKRQELAAAEDTARK